MSLPNPLAWLFLGKICKSCGDERTGKWIDDDLCDTCYYVKLLKALVNLK